MPVDCYQVVEYAPDSDGRVRVKTYALAPQNTNLYGLLQMVAPTVRLASRTLGDLPGNHQLSYLVPERQKDAVLALLDRHRDPVVTAIDAHCEVSVCLSFHHHVLDGVAPQDWERTEIGQLVWQAKYHDNQSAVSDCSERVVSYIRDHPILRGLTAVAAMPGSRVGASSRVPARVARDVSDVLGIPVVPLWRSAKTTAQKTLPAESDPETNQRGTMRASLDHDPDLVVVVDDLMGHGSSIREASRALRAAGAVSVGSVALVKNIRGTLKYKFN